MSLTVLVLTTTSLDDQHKKEVHLQQNFFSLHACVYLTFPLTDTYGYGRLCDRCDYMDTAFFAIICDCFGSVIRDRLRSYGNQP